MSFEDIGRAASEAAQAARNGHNAQWGEPEPLSDPADKAAPYPLDALPVIMREAVRAYQHYGQQPLAIVAGSALASASLAVQGLVNVRRDGLLCSPASLSIVTIAPSGERKTAADRAMRKGADDWQKDTLKRLGPKIDERVALLEAFEAERAGLASALRSEKAKKKSDARDANVAELKREIVEHAKKKPVPAGVPILFYEDSTIEKLQTQLRVSWPSASWWSNEGGAVFGGHAFSEESAMRSFSAINKLWDGQAIDRARIGDGHSIAYGRRLTVSIMLQPVVLGRLVTGQDGLARGLGALARFLTSWPDSTAGTREYREAPDVIPELAAFHQRIRELLDRPLPMPFDLNLCDAPDLEGGADPLELAPAELHLSRPAFDVWRTLHDDVERELKPEGDYASVRDVAAKTADVAARLAAIFHTLELAPAGTIGADHMAAAGGLAVWHLHEARRVLSGACVAGDGDEAGDAKVLADWLLTQTAPVPLKHVSQYAPYRVRKKDRRDRALEFLSAKGWTQVAPHHGPAAVFINPALKTAL